MTLSKYGIFHQFKVIQKNTNVISLTKSNLLCPWIISNTWFLLASLVKNMFKNCKSYKLSQKMGRISERNLSALNLVVAHKELDLKSDAPVMLACFIIVSHRVWFLFSCVVRGVLSYFRPFGPSSLCLPIYAEYKWRFSWGISPHRSHTCRAIKNVASIFIACQTNFKLPNPVPSNTPEQCH